MKSTHLSDAMLFEMAEAGKSHPHISECDRCRRAFEEARGAVMLARAEQVPEPSPLFWERFSARVHEAVDNEADAGRRRAYSWFFTAGWRPVAALGLVGPIILSPPRKGAFLGIQGLGPWKERNCRQGKGQVGAG